MSWLFSRVLVEAFWAGTCSAGGACARSSGSPMPPAFSSHGRMTGFSRLSRFGMTCEPLTDAYGEALLTWSREASRARILARRARERGSMGSEAACGRRWPGSLARWDRDTCSWRTHQFSLLGGLELFSETWPRWGMMRGGECWERTMPVLRTSGTGYGYEHGLAVLFPTPDTGRTPNGHGARGGKPGNGKQSGALLTAMAKHAMGPTPTKDDANNVTRKSGEFQSLTRSVQMFPTPTKQDASNNGGPSQMERNSLPLNAVAGGALNPMWVEWLMEWPLGWTDLRPLGMDRFRQWCASHGRRCGAEDDRSDLIDVTG